MENTDLLIQFLQYILGVIPGDVAGNIMVVVTFVVTICTLIIRFWKEPSQDSQTYKLWKFLHVLASFKKPVEVSKNNGTKTD